MWRRFKAKAKRWWRVWKADGIQFPEMTSPRAQISRFPMNSAQWLYQEKDRTRCGPLSGKQFYHFMQLITMLSLNPTVLEKTMYVDINGILRISCPHLSLSDMWQTHHHSFAFPHLTFFVKKKKKNYCYHKYLFTLQSEGSSCVCS